MNPRLKALADAGVSIWLDDLSRSRINSGNLTEMINENSVSGVTTNPTIFAGALRQGADYRDALRALGPVSEAEAITALWAADVRDACDIFADLYASSAGFNGRVSIEVDPGLAMETEATIAQAQELYDLVDRENVLIKIPATKPGIPAIAATIAAGISVNVTLIFSVERYVEVMEAYLSGLEQAAAAGRDLSKIHSVASVFVSRIDTEIDARLAALGRLDLKGKAAIANAQVALAAYQGIFASERFAALKAKGANVQRPLWASTGTKDPSYPDTLYVSELVIDGCVNTMPEGTLLAFADHGEVTHTMADSGAIGAATMAEIAGVGIDIDEVMVQLETEAVDKFNVSWAELIESVQVAMASAN